MLGLCFCEMVVEIDGCGNRSFSIHIADVAYFLLTKTLLVTLPLPIPTPAIPPPLPTFPTSSSNPGLTLLLISKLLFLPPCLGGDSLIPKELTHLPSPALYTGVPALFCKFCI